MSQGERLLFKIMHKTILLQLGISFYEATTRTTGHSAEAVYQNIKKHFYLRDALTFLGGMIAFLAMHQQLYYIALSTIAVIIVFRLPLYWEITNIGVANAHCARAWQRARSHVKKTESFRKLCREMELKKCSWECTIKYSPHFTDCLAEIRSDQTMLPAKLPIAAFETP